MAVRLEILTDAKVKFRNGKEKHYEAIYPNHNGLYVGTITKETSIFEQSRRRRFGFAKPVEKKQVCYNVFCDQGFLRDNTYTFFTGEECYAYTQKLTNGEIRDEFF